MPPDSGMAPTVHLLLYLLIIGIVRTSFSIETPIGDDYSENDYEEIPGVIGRTLANGTSQTNFQPWQKKGEPEEADYSESDSDKIKEDLEHFRKSRIGTTIVKERSKINLREPRTMHKDIFKLNKNDQSVNGTDERKKNSGYSSTRSGSIGTTLTNQISKSKKRKLRSYVTVSPILNANPSSNKPQTSNGPSISFKNKNNRRIEGPRYIIQGSNDDSKTVSVEANENSNQLDQGLSSENEKEGGLDVENNSDARNSSSETEPMNSKLKDFSNSDGSRSDEYSSKGNRRYKIRPIVYGVSGSNIQIYYKVVKGSSSRSSSKARGKKQTSGHAMFRRAHYGQTYQNRRKIRRPTYKNKRVGRRPTYEEMRKGLGRNRRRYDSTGWSIDSEHMNE